MISERDIIYITKKQASISVAVLAVFCLLVFMIGYFWGKQSVLEGFGQRVTQESLQDQADYLATMQSFVEKSEPEVITKKEPSFDEVVQKSLDNEAEKVATTEYKSNSSKVSNDAAQKTNTQKVFAKKYRAILLGFGTKPAALAFVNRLKKHNILVEIKPRVSKSASGKVKKTWYQVVTKSFDSKNDVQEVVNKIRKFERIKDSDIKIV